MMTRLRLSGPLAVLFAAQLALAGSSAHAFDLEDYAGTYRDRRNGYLKALNEYHLALTPFLAARLVAEAYGLNVADEEIPLGSRLRPDWCDGREGGVIEDTGGVGIDTFAYSGSFDFYGRGHDLHPSGEALDHHQAVTVPGHESPPPMTLEEALAFFLEHEGVQLEPDKPNMCWPEWWDGGDPEYPIIADVRSYYSDRYLAMRSALKQLTQAIPPYLAAKAAYTAAVEAYGKNEPCGTWMLPNLPDLSDASALGGP